MKSGVVSVVGANVQSPCPIHTGLLQEGIPWEWPQDAGKRFRTQNLINIYHEALGTTLLTP